MLTPKFPMTFAEFAKIVLPLTCLLCLLSACDKEPPAAASPAAPAIAGERISFNGRPQGIRTEPVENSSAGGLSLPGRLVWDEDHTVRVFSPFAGRVVRSLVQPGDKVKAGQPVAELASPDFGQAQADARKAAADLTLARQNLNRATELNAAGIVADKDLHAAQADFRRADGENTRAQQRLQQVGASDGSNFLLKAPIAGMIVEKAINPGQEFRPDQPAAPLFLITDPTRLWVWLDAAETDLAQLNQATPGTPFTLTSSAFSGRSFSGKVLKMSDYVDPTSRTVRLLGAVDNSKRELKAEMFVTARFAMTGAPSAEPQQTIPASAVIQADEKHYVFAQENESTFRRVEVKQVRQQAERITVTGLDHASKIVTEGNLYLQQLLLSERQNPAPAESKPAASVRDGTAARSEKS